MLVETPGTVGKIRSHMSTAMAETCLAFQKILAAIHHAGIDSCWLVITCHDVDDTESIEIPSQDHADYESLKSRKTFLDEMHNISLQKLCDLSK